MTNESKSTTVTVTNEGANSTSIYPHVKAGQAIPYDSPARYDDMTDPLSGNALTYDTVGTEPTWSNENKS